MLTDRNHRACLRSFDTFRVLRDKPHFGADGERVKAVSGDAVAVEVDLLARAGEDEPAILSWQQLRDPAMVRRFMLLDLAAALAGMVFQPAPQGIEGIADRDMGILMGVIGAAIPADDDPATRDFQIDSHGKQLALLMMAVTALDNHPA